MWQNPEEDTIILYYQKGIVRSNVWEDWFEWIHHVDAKYKIVRPGAIFAHGYALSYVTVPVQNTGVQEQKMQTKNILIRFNFCYGISNYS